MSGDGGAKMVERENIFPEGMPKRIVKGHVLYSPVVTVVPGKLVFVSGILSRNSKGEIVGKGDMAAQIRQVFENIKTALAAAGATMADVVKRQTFTTDIDAYFENIDARMEHGGDNLSTSTTVEVRRLSHPDFLIEVEVMAVLPQWRRRSWLRRRLAPFGADEGDADLAAQPPHHAAFPARALVAGDQQMELVGHLDAVGKQPCALLGNVGDHAVARQRAGIGLEFGDPVDGVASVLATFVGHRLCPDAGASSGNT